MKMKKVYITIVLVAVTSVNILAQTMVSTSPKNRRAVIEQFNGCGYCPDSHRISDSICRQNADDVFDIRIFQGSFAQSSLPHFVTQWGDALANISSLDAYPSAMINRHSFPSIGYRSIYRHDYAKAVDTILRESTPVNIAATASINDTTRMLTVYVELYYTANSSRSINYLNVALLQNNIIDNNISFQSLYPEMEIGSSQYRYMHVLRDMLTGQWGDSITSTTEGSYITRTYTYHIPDSIGMIGVPNLCDLEVIAFVAESHTEILDACRASFNVVDTNIGVAIYVNDSTQGYVIEQHCILTGGIMVMAYAHQGYEFLMWSDSVSANPRTIDPAVDTSLAALFGIKEYLVEVNVNDTAMGYVIGGGYYHYGDTVCLLAIPSTNHHHFVRWNNGYADTNAQKTIIIKGNTLVTANFAINIYYVSVVSDDILYGSVAGGGSFEYGQPCTVNATPYSGFRFSNWNNGTTYNPYTFAVIADSTLVAYYVADDSLMNSKIDTVYIHDTSYIDVHDTMLIVDTVMLTEYVLVHDTTYVIQTDTVTYTVTVTNTVHDTTMVYQTDTLWLTEYVHDTIYIHDTVFVGIEDVETVCARLYQRDGQIVVEGAEGMPVAVYDALGRMLTHSSVSRIAAASSPNIGEQLEIAVPTSGVYLVKIGNLPARRIVVVR